MFQGNGLFHFLQNFSTEMPRSDPSIDVMMNMGMRLNGSFQPMMIAAGVKTAKETVNPLRYPAILRSVTVRRNPTITHIENAEMSASTGNF